MEPRRFYLDTANRSFVASADTTVPAPTNLFFREDVEAVELYFLKPTGNLAAPYQYLNYGSNTVKLAVGLTTPAALQTSWTSASTTVTASITTLTDGGSGANEVQRLTFSSAPAMGSYALTMPSRNVTVSSVSAGVFTAANHGLLDGQSVTLSSFTISGSTFSNAAYFVSARTKDTFRIAASVGGTTIAAAVTSGGGTATLDAITTPQLAYNATASDIQQAFVDAGITIGSAPQIVVTGDRSNGFTFAFANSQANINFGALTLSGNTLSGAPSLSANVSFNTSEIASLISAGNTTNLRFEVEVAGSGKRQTYATTADISADIITSTSPSPIPTTTANSFNLSDGAGGVWTVTVDANGILTTAKQ